MKRRALSQVGRILLIQCLAIAGVSMLLGSFYPLPLAYAVFIGGAIGIVPNAVFALILVGDQGRRCGKQLMAAFYAGETIKWLITIGLFIVTFIWLTTTAWAVLVGLITAQVAFWIAAKQA